MLLHRFNVSRLKGDFFAKAVRVAMGFAVMAIPAILSAQNMDCTLIMPHNPLTAAGLATPYQLVATDPAAGVCNQTNPAQSAFVQAAIIDKQTGQIAIYQPLVIDQGTSPAVAPVVPVLPQRYVAALWFGFNGNNLSLQGEGDDLQDNRCRQGLGQFMYCNAVSFFEEANEQIWWGKLKVPALGISPKDHQPCPSVRSFAVIDQDQSDNITTLYLVTPKGQMAQNNAANRAAFPGATTMGNPSDNRLTAVFLDGALGCTPWTVPDLTDPAGAVTPGLPLNELQAAAFQKRPIAKVPLSDPFVLKPPFTGVPSLAQVNRYRRGVNQPMADDANDADPTAYCQNFRKIQTAKLILDQPFLTAFRSPDPAAANSLFTFMAQRYVASYANLNCQTLLNQSVNITVTTDAKGVAISATIQP